MKALEQQFLDFLTEHNIQKKPFLLGLSGGPDSLALFYLLLENRDKLSLKFGIAHIDHNWRPESAQEAEQLRLLAEKFQLPFHLLKLDPLQLKGNLEAACREERIQFFLKLCKQFGYHAVMVGHHSDDQSETVLKRVLEGANITQLAALQPVSRVNDVIFLRPLLHTPKLEILKWLEKNNISAFNDSTNLDPKFLRGRMRSQIIPELTATFGKEISHNLCVLAEESLELKNYLKEILKEPLSAIKKEKFCTFLDLSENPLGSSFAIKFLLRELCHQEGCSLPRSHVNSACEAILNGKSNFSLNFGVHSLYIDRRRIFLYKSLPTIAGDKVPVAFGSHAYGPWKVTVTSENQMNRWVSGWKQVLKGKLEITLPESDYQLAPVELQAAYPGMNNPISKWWTNEKIPAFLRNSVPVIWEKGFIKHEFLSGRCKSNEDKNGMNGKKERFMKIVLELGS